MNGSEKQRATDMLRLRFPYSHLCLLESILEKYQPASAQEAEMAAEIREITTNARRMSHWLDKVQRS